MKFVVGLAAVLFAGCVAEGDESPYGNGGTGGSTGDLGAEVQAIFDRTCSGSGCHGGAEPQASLSLEADVAFAQLIGVPGVTCAGDRVAPGDPDASCLWQLVDSDAMPPRPFDPLSPAEKETIRSWILSLEDSGTGGAGGGGEGGAGGSGGSGEGAGGTGGTGGSGGEVTLDADIQPIFDRSCTGSCHGTTRPAGSLSLVRGVSGDALIGVSCDATSLRVDPGNLENSCLWHLVDSNLMPKPPNSPLSSSDKDLIRRWIEGGAKR